MNEYSQHNFDTLSQAQNAYMQEGYTEQFDTSNGVIMAMTDKTTYEPTDLWIVEDFRFEGMSNPADNMILYIIEAKDGRKGTLVDNVGGADTAQDPDLIQAIPFKNKESH